MKNKKLTSRSKNKLIIQESSDSMLNASAEFWINEFDKLMKLRDEMEHSDERFELSFTEKMTSVEKQIEEVAGHMFVELTSMKKANEEWKKIENLIYDYENITE